MPSSGAAYRSPLRDEQVAATRERLLEACVAVVEAGRELTYAAVAAAAGVQERTVYRYFRTKRELEAGLWQWIVDRLTGAELTASDVEELVVAVHRSFRGFDAGAPLIAAMLRTQQGLEVRKAQQEPRRTMFERCVDASAPGLPVDTRRRAAAALQVLYSAASWDLLRTVCDMDGPEAAEVVEIGVRALLAGLRDVAGPNRDTFRSSPRQDP